MIYSFFTFFRPLFHSLDAERAHDLAIAGLKLWPSSSCSGSQGSEHSVNTALSVSCFGREFTHPIGLAAGFDKKGEVIDALLSLGFSFVEAGGVTPLPQSGNPGPRVFRLAEDSAVINRYGLNSDGFDAMRRRLTARNRQNGILGINLGANKDSKDRIADYVAGIHMLAPFADFMTLNISSPNTPGLRDLQGESFLDDLLARSRAALEETQAPCALLVKLAPDSDDTFLDTCLATILRRKVDGIVLTNTTLARPTSLRSRHAGETGGLSGRPLFEPSTRLLAKAFLRLEGKIPLIGVGGIDSGDAAWSKITAGATLLQLYTGLIYKGPGLIADIRNTLLDRLRENGFNSLDAARGTKADEWARC
jgi:dihydroorotate dehydrogenase